MTEIITRLRDYQQWLDDSKNTGTLILDISGDRSCERAANEIERLNKALSIIANSRKVIKRKSIGELFCIRIAKKALAK